MSLKHKAWQHDKNEWHGLVGRYLG